jgi:DNA-binding response OmpR family regulator
MDIRYPAAPDQRPRILVVEPNRAYLGVLAHRLSEAGFRVTTADSGASAIAELYRFPIDLVLAELNMPRMSGAELARAVRGEVQWNDIPVLLITGKSKPADAVRAYEAGADDVILKPFHFEVLAARIERRIDRARSVKQLRDDNAALDARVIERAIQIGELRDELRAARSNPPRNGEGDHQAAAQMVEGGPLRHAFGAPPPRSGEELRNSLTAGPTSLRSKAIAILAITNPAALPQS